MSIVLITGSCGLVGSESSFYFAKKGALKGFLVLFIIIYYEPFQVQKILLTVK